MFIINNISKSFLHMKDTQISPEGDLLAFQDLKAGLIGEI